MRQLNRNIPSEIEAEVRQTVYLLLPGIAEPPQQGDFFEKCGRGKYRVTRPRLEDFDFG
jgi:hypothetical protein